MIEGIICLEDVGLAIDCKFNLLLFSLNTDISTQLNHFCSIFADICGSNLHFYKEFKHVSNLIFFQCIHYNHHFQVIFNIFIVTNFLYYFHCIIIRFDQFDFTINPMVRILARYLLLNNNWHHLHDHLLIISNFIKTESSRYLINNFYFFIKRMLDYFYLFLFGAVFLVVYEVYE